MKSHITVTKKILEYFSHQDIDEKGESDFIYFWELDSGLIDKKRIRYFGTHPGYYRDEIEDYLSKIYEGNFSRLVKDIIFGNRDIGTFSFDEIKAITKFAFSMRYRNKQLQDKIVDALGKKKLKIDQNDIISTIECLKNDLSASYIVLFEAKDSMFVLPFNCMIKVKNFYNISYVLPISPSYAIGLKIGETTDKIFRDKILLTESEVDLLNHSAIKFEEISSKLIIGFTLEQLEKLKKERESYGHIKFEA